MREKELSEFNNRSGDTNSSPLPDTAPESLLEGFLPQITDRTEIAPEHPTCDMKLGDLLVIYVGDDAMEYYGFLLLEDYANTLIGINLHNQTYGTRELNSWIEWYEEYEEAGAFSDGTKRIYTDVAPVTTTDGTQNPQKKMAATKEPVQN